MKLPLGLSIERGLHFEGPFSLTISDDTACPPIKRRSVNPYKIVDSAYLSVHRAIIYLT